ncbi:MAG: cytochrome C [Rhodoferax sp.]|nr:cytochrome C [Rhodoferax sp.]
MKRSLLTTIACTAIALPAMAADVTYRNDIAPMFKAQCAECHSADAKAPTLQEYKLDQKKYDKEKVGPRTDTYENLVMLIAYPDSGALMRRLDDGTSTLAGGKPGNMYKNLGSTDAERVKNLATVKAWLGEGAWNLNRWSKKGEVPGITKEEQDKLVLKY